MANETVIFTFEGETADLESSVDKAQASIAGLGTTTKATSDKMSKSMGKATKATKSMDKATGSTSSSMDSMNSATGKAQESVGALGSAISVVNPELGSMVQQSSAVIGGLKGMTSGAGLLGGSTLVVLGAALAAVAGAAYLVYKQFQTTKKETRELGGSIDGVSIALDTMEENQDRGAAALTGFRESVRKASLEISVLRGEMTSLEKAQDEAALSVALGIKPSMDAAAQSMTAAQQEVKALTSTLERFEATKYDPDIFIADPSEQLAAAQARVQASQDLLDSLKSERKEGQEIVTTALQLAEAQKQGAVASSERSKAEAEANAESEQAEADRIERLGDLEDALDSIRDMQHEAAKATLSDMQLIEDAENEALQNLTSRFEEGQALAEGDNEKQLELVIAFEEAKLSIEAEYAEKRKALKEEEEEEEEERRKWEIEDSIASARIIADATSAIADAAMDHHKSNLDDLREYRRNNGENMTKEEKKQLNKRIKEEKKAMRQIAIAQKMAAIMDIGIKTAQGIMAVWAQFAAFPPVAAALTAVVSTAGLVSQIAVASQKVEFHRGGVVDAALLPGESVLNRQATESLGNEGVDRLNSGRGGMAPSVTLQIGRREAREIIRTDVRSGGMVTQEIGRIANTFGNVGLSGLPVLA